LGRGRKGEKGKRIIKGDRGKEVLLIKKHLISKEEEKFFPFQRKGKKKKNLLENAKFKRKKGNLSFREKKRRMEKTSWRNRPNRKKGKTPGKEKRGEVVHQ